ncbi:hypothetical protein HHL25_03025 [Rhizobium sp. S-51]|uniref:Uncharacterized protein n=1 Tax=Rhizobium terricola TaxID=2728849 RepID=A0A7Y0FU72_9HYPH|nr:hypothetical protein [Rhizobium terricola]NML73092.1 hypothetical protein [Rhizobium terricola]
MKPYLAAAILFAAPVLTSSVALAQSPDIARTCEAVARNFEMVKAVKVGIVQSFPELKPPGARLTYSTRLDAKDEDIGDMIECQFKEATAPLTLVRFCLGTTCYSADEKNPEHRRRFEEAQSLLAREP